VDSKQKEKGRNSGNGSEGEFEVGQGLTHLKPNITLANVTFYEYVQKRKKKSKYGIVRNKEID
jgi:hypothetical protein